MRIKYLVIGFVLIALAAASGIAIALWVFQHFKIYIPLEDQAVNIDLQEPLQAKVQIHDALDVNVTGRVKTTIPIRENLSIPVQQTLNPIVHFDNQVPIKTVIPVRENLIVDQNLAVDTKVKVRILGKDITLPLKGTIPIKLDVPVEMDVPLDQMVHLKFQAPVQADLKENLRIPLNKDLDVDIPVQGHLNAPIKTALEASVNVQNTLPIKIQKGELVIPLNTLTLQKNQKVEAASPIKVQKDDQSAESVKAQ